MQNYVLLNYLSSHDRIKNFEFEFERSNTYVLDLLHVNTLSYHTFNNPKLLQKAIKYDFLH